MKQYTYIGRDKGNLLIREVVNGKTQKPKISKDFAPSIFVDAKEDTGWKNIYGKPVKRVDFESVKDFNDYIYKVKDVKGSRLYGNKSVEYQYIREVYPNRDKFDPGAFNICYFDIEVARDHERGYAPADNPFNPVVLITAFFPYKEEGDKVHVWELAVNEHGPIKDTTFHVFKTDRELIADFFRFMVESDVDVITGWNIEAYDVPYLCGRLLGEFDGGKTDKRYYKVDTSITPFGLINRRIVHGSYGKDQLLYDIPGWSNMDYFNLYRKFTYITRESYSLNNICYCELGEKKVDYSEMQHLQELYEKDYEKFIRYGIKDTLLVEKLDEKLQLLYLSFTLAYIIGCNLEDIWSPVRSWEIFLYNDMMDSYIAPPIEKEASFHKENFIGAFVKDPIRGKHKWCLSFDLNSLYPHIMMFCNMSPETYVRRDDMNLDQKLLYQNMQANVGKSIEQLLNHEVDLSILKERNVTMAPNGAMYRRDVQGIIPRAVKRLYSDRKETKKLMLENQKEYENNKDIKLKLLIAALNAKQMALKILMNALFGASGNEHFLFFNMDMAEGITSMGQVAIRYIGQELEKFLNEILKTDGYVRLLYSDTDSCYIKLEDVAERLQKSKKDITDQQIADILDKFAEDKIQSFIDETYEKLRDYLNGYEQSFKMKREKIIQSMIFVQKKRYTMAVIDNEGVRYHDLKVSTTGLESVRSTTPEVLRGKLHDFEKILLLGTEDEAQNYLSSFKREFRGYRIEDIAMVKSVNEIEKWVNEDRTSVATGTPLQVKAATLYNKIMLEHDPHVSTIKSGDKIHLVYVKRSPKFLNESCIAYPQVIPVELGLTREIVDWNVMYEKTFLSAAQILMNALGMEARTRSAVSLSSFFG